MLSANMAVIIGAKDIAFVHYGLNIESITYVMLTGLLNTDFVAGPAANLVEIRDICGRWQLLLL